MKSCRTCGEMVEPTEAKQKKYDYQCRRCVSKDNKVQYVRRKSLGLPVSGSKNWDAEKKKKWWEAYHADPEKKKYKAELQRKYRNDPTLRHRHMARWMAHRALNSGKITRGLCIVCGNANSQMHHEDYYKPLEITWLCLQCHRIYHAKAKGE